jgi:glycosyltransferase involved in cell wall biosynthesis
MGNPISQPPRHGAGHNPGRSHPAPLVSVVIPTFNEVANIRLLIDEVIRILEECQVGIEIIAVDDGSTDTTFDEIARLYHAESRVKVLRFSRNFGKEAALLAGLRAAEGDAIITMDADFQHPPSLIPDLLKCWRRGAKIVHGVKRSRDSDPWLVRTRAAIFNALMARLTGVNLRQSSDFKLLDRVAAHAIVRDFREHARFYRGLTAWIGYPATAVPFDVGARERGSRSRRRCSRFLVVWQRDVRLHNADLHHSDCWKFYHDQPRHHWRVPRQNL